NSNIADATAKFLWERVKRLLDYIDEMLVLHLSPTDTSKAGSLRVTIAFFFALVLILFFVVILFVFFLLWLLSKGDIGSHRAIRGACVEVFWMYSAHAQWYASHPLATTVTASP